MPKETVGSIRFPQLDGLKGIGACIVAFCWHYRHFGIPVQLPFCQYLPFSFQDGWLMVELFFMLSGFGMAIGYERRIRERSIGFIPYIMRRVRKLYPLFLLTTVMVIILEYAYQKSVGQTFIYPNFDIYHIFLNLFLIQDGYLGTEWSLNSPSWCISICLMLYIVFYLVCRNVKTLRHTYYCFAFLVLVGLSFIIVGSDGPLFNTLTGRGLSCFSIGVLISGLVFHGESLDRKRIGYCCLIALLGCYVLFAVKGSARFGNLQLAYIIGLAPMVVVSSITIPWVGKLLSIKPFLELGKLSISIYLLHFPVQLTMRCVEVYGGVTFDYQSVLVWLVYAFVVLAVAELYTRVIRKKFEPWLLSLFVSKNDLTDS